MTGRPEAAPLPALWLRLRGQKTSVLDWLWFRTPIDVRVQVGVDDGGLVLVLTDDKGEIERLQSQRSQERLSTTA